MAFRVRVTFTEQQLELIDASVSAGEAASREELVYTALSEVATGVTTGRARPEPGEPWEWSADLDANDTGTVLDEFELAPGSGKAIEMPAGTVLRVEQIVGNQCADLNVFNLHDYREFMHVGRTRTLHGVNPTAGDFLWSAPPRERALMYIQADTAGINDTLFPRCSANLYESLFGLHSHTNCADIQAEAQREYGLTPDDVHDSFNLFMATRVHEGMPQVLDQSTVPGDHVELLALVDVLAVPNVCGNDIMPTSNHWLSPLRIELRTATRAEIDAVPPLRRYATQRTPRDFRQPVIRAERALRRDAAYVADFARTPIVTSTVDVELDDASAAALSLAKATVRSDDDAIALREIVLSWWVASHA